MSTTKKTTSENKLLQSAQICRCPACAGALEYEPGKAEIVCKNCRNKFSLIENIDNLEFVNYNAKTLNKFSESDDDYDGDKLSDHLFTTYKSECPSCGESIENERFVTGKCPSCGNAYYIPFDQVEAKVEPTAIFPFQTTREDVSRKFRWWYRFNLHRILFFMKLKFDNAEKVVPYYYPVWLFNAKAKIVYSGKMTPSPFSDSQDVQGEFETEMTHIPVHALLSYESKMASYCVRDLNWETMEPKKFVPELIAGIRTKPFFHNAEKMIPKASDSLYENATKLAKKDMGGAHQEVQELTVKYSEISCVPVLIPVWMATSSCNGKPVWFCMNGMSGKYIARSPAPKKNQIWTLGIILTILYVWLAGYLQYTSGIINFGTVIISAVFAIFSVASIMAGLKKVFSMKLSIWLAIGVDLFYLFISLRHFKTMIWYHFAIFGFIGLVFLLWRLSSSGAVDESEYEESDLTKLE